MKKQPPHPRLRVIRHDIDPAWKLPWRLEGQAAWEAAKDAAATLMALRTIKPDVRELQVFVRNQLLAFCDEHKKDLPCPACQAPDYCQQHDIPRVHVECPVCRGHGMLMHKRGPRGRRPLWPRPREARWKGSPSW